MPVWPLLVPRGVACSMILVDQIISDKADILRQCGDYQWHIFLSGHRALYRNDLVNMDVSYRKLCRQIVGPPPGTHCSLDWYEILHFWE